MNADADADAAGAADADAKAEDALAQGKGKQMRAPWHRDKSTLPPVARQQSAGATKKGASFFDSFI